MTIPAFRPHRLLPGGHLQTLAGAWIGGGLYSSFEPRDLRIDLPDEDALILRDDGAPGWRPDDPVALFVHGLCGSSESPYILRVASKLRERGVRTFRLNLRGCGVGRGLARHPYHAGRSEDIEATIQAIQLRCPGSPIHLAGVSLGGNIVLKWLSEQHDPAGTPVDRAIAVNPPVDLHSCSLASRTQTYGLYGRYFARRLYRHVRECPELKIHNIWKNGIRPPRQMMEFDEAFTAPRCGYRSALDYYDECSAGQKLHQISIPTLILTARDDPLVPVRIFENLPLSASTRLHVAESGGHLGYVGRRGEDADGWWLDWRIVDWFVAGNLVAVLPASPIPNAA